MTNLGSHPTKASWILSGHWLSTVGSRFFFSAAAWFLTASLGVSAASWSLAVFQFVPVILAMPLCLAVVDYLGRRRIVLWCDAIRCGICLLGAGVMALTGETVPALLGCIFLIKVCDTFYTPTMQAGVGAAARSARKYSPQFVLMVVNSSAALLAPLLIPVAVETTVPIALLVNAASFLLSFGAFNYAGDVLDQSAGDRRSLLESLRKWRSSLATGFAAFRRAPVLTTIVPTLPLIDLSFAGLTVMLPAVAMAAYPEQGGFYYAVLVLTYGISRIAGAFIGRRFVHGRHDGRFLALNCFTQGVLYFVAAATLHSPSLPVVLALLGIMSGAASLSVNEIVQSCVQPELRARVFSLIAFSVVLLMPLGPVVSGIVSAHSVALTVAALGAGLLIVGSRPLMSRSIWSFRLSKEQETVAS
jgi:MFS transporter, DHA3 family, macrolide efflux protein